MTILVGHVRELWRFPVKSMQGERLDRAIDVGLGQGVAGDRGWAIRAESVGEIQGGKKISGLLGCAARATSRSPPPAARPTWRSRCPTGQSVRSDDPNVHAALSAAVGRRRHVVAAATGRRRGALPASRRDRRSRDAAAVRARRRRAVARLQRDPGRDHAGAHGVRLAARHLLRQHRAALLTTASLASLAALAPDSRIDVRRFRPNFFVDSGDATGFPEEALVRPSTSHRRDGGRRRDDHATLRHGRGTRRPTCPTTARSSEPSCARPG